MDIFYKDNGQKMHKVINPVSTNKFPFLFWYAPVGTFTSSTNATFPNSFKFDSLPYSILKCGFDNRVKSCHRRQQGRSTDLSMDITSASLLAASWNLAVFSLHLTPPHLQSFRSIRCECASMCPAYGWPSFMTWLKIKNFKNHFLTTSSIVPILFFEHLNASYFILFYFPILSPATIFLLFFSWSVST